MPADLLRNVAQRRQGRCEGRPGFDAAFASTDDAGNLPAEHPGVAAAHRRWIGALRPFQNSFHFHSNKMAVLRAKKVDKNNGISKIRIVSVSPEKAGVGGSIPS